MPGMRLSEPRVGTDLYEPKRSPGRMHYDVWFLVGAVPADDLTLDIPPWYAELAWHDPRALSAAEWARGHEDVAARWLQTRDQRVHGT